MYPVAVHHLNPEFIMTNIGSKAILIMLTILVATCAGAVELRFDPHNGGFVMGQDITLSIFTDEVVDIRTIELTIAFDPAILAPVDGNPGALYDAAGCSIFDDYQNDTPGECYGAAVTIGFDCWVTGPGELYNFIFHTLAEGVSPINVVMLRLYNPAGDVIEEVILPDTHVYVGLDFGDAPDPTYPTLMVSDGPRHTIMPGWYLGVTVDSDLDGQPTPLADGDDLAGVPDDEDGVTFTSILTTGSSAEIAVDCGPAGGMLDGWIDFDGNGAFDHPAEHLGGGVSQLLVTGANTLIISVPAGAAIGDTHARFRLSEAGSLLPTGHAYFGEVEDYLVTVVAPETGTIIIEKQTDPDGSSEMFSFTGDAAGIIGDDGQIVVSALPPGTYTCTEMAAAGWDLTSIVLDDGNSSGDIVTRTATFVLEAGETVTAVFTNTLQLDFGDAPDPTYPTLLANDGARHTVVPGFFLGGAVDTESDGQPTPLADGDDLAGAPDDEDGVVFTSVVAQGHLVNVQVTASVPGLLNAWMDYNFDGDWADAGEQFFIDTPLAAGINDLSFMLPASANEGNTYARFRLSSTGGLTFAGPAADGEVEDYQVEIFDESVPVLLQFHDVGWVDDAIEVRWILSETDPDFEFTLLRSQADGGISPVSGAVLTRDHTTFTYRDATAEPGEEYTYRVTLETSGVSLLLFEKMVVTPALRFALFPNQPNPFNPNTTISYSLDTATPVSLQIVDIQGRVVRTLVSGSMEAGTYRTTWNGRDDQGRQLASGVYFSLLSTSSQIARQKMVLLK
jgi:hypothetical protein